MSGEVPPLLFWEDEAAMMARLYGPEKWAKMMEEARPTTFTAMSEHVRINLLKELADRLGEEYTVHQDGPYLVVNKVGNDTVVLVNRMHGMEVRARMNADGLEGLVEHIKKS